MLAGERGRKRSWSQRISNGIHIAVSARAMTSKQARWLINRFEPESLLTYRSVGFDPANPFNVMVPGGMPSSNGDNC